MKGNGGCDNLINERSDDCLDIFLTAIPKGLPALSTSSNFKCSEFYTFKYQKHSVRSKSVYTANCFLLWSSSNSLYVLGIAMGDWVRGLPVFGRNGIMSL